MAKLNIQPTDRERVMRDDDFIVSKTDLRGRITYGNRTFSVYAGLTESQYIGKPHNLIRHPDMPKGVFKLLWSTIEQGHEVFAFVKNLASDGSCYWVFANVTPSFDAAGQMVGYYSVRRKASRKGIEAVTALYRRMLQIEQAAPSQKEGIEQSLAWITQELQAMNQTYEQFVLGLQR